MALTIWACTLQVSRPGPRPLPDPQPDARPSSLPRRTERMIVRLLAFALNADEHLRFTRGLSRDDEPDLWQHSLNGEITLWVEKGENPTKSGSRKGCARSRGSLSIASSIVRQRGGSRSRQKLERFSHLSVFKLPEEVGRAACIAGTTQYGSAVHHPGGGDLVVERRHQYSVHTRKWR